MNNCYPPSRFLETRRLEILAEMEEKKNALLHEMSGVDKETLTKLRNIVDDYYNARNNLETIIFDIAQKGVETTAKCNSDFNTMLAEHEGNINTLVNELVTTLSTMKEQFALDVHNILYSVDMDEYVRTRVSGAVDEYVNTHNGGFLMESQLSKQMGNSDTKIIGQKTITDNFNALYDLFGAYVPNILNPDNTRSGFYSAVGGVIEYVDNPSAQCTRDAICVEGVNRLYVSHNLIHDFSDTLYNIAFYFMGDDNVHITTISRTIANINGVIEINVPSTAKYVHISTNGINKIGHSLSDFCISLSNNPYYPYGAVKIPSMLKSKYLPIVHTTGDSDSHVMCQKSATEMFAQNGDVFEGEFIRRDIIPSDLKTDKRPLANKVIVNFGDSIFGNYRPPLDVSTFIANVTGATVHNCGFGGCRMASHTIPNFDAFSMYRLADAIATHSFALQDSAVESGKIATTEAEGKLPAYFENSLALLKSIDFNAVDIITIAYGTNDFMSYKKIDDENDLYNTANFAGALRYSIETILTAYPHIQIFVCSQIYRFWVDGDGEFTEDSNTYVYAERKLTDFVTKTKEVTGEYNIPFIDNYYELGINRFTRTHYFSGKDGTHPNENGRKLLAQHIANKLF